MPENKKIVINTGPCVGHCIRKGHKFSMQTAIEKMQQNGIWLSDEVIKFALDNTNYD